MKKFSLVSLALLAGVSMFGAKKGPEVSKIEPPYWWVGMANDTLQLMVLWHGYSQSHSVGGLSGGAYCRECQSRQP